ncbi:MAG: dUTP diphosphatase [Erysipelothrix sp.]|nr:dUTP diphosphatase [Erysipelothrix sp.]
MIIDTSLYMPYQRELDERIFSTHQTNRENTRIDRTLALCVELSEFVNETRCFKYWSLKPASDLSVLLEEYADGLHFLNSLCIDLDYAPVIESSPSHTTLSEATLKAYQTIMLCVENFDVDHLKDAYQAYANIGEMCGFTSEMIFEAYISKHKKNHVRQDEHY